MNNYSKLPIRLRSEKIWKLFLYTSIGKRQDRNDDGKKLRVKKYLLDSQNCVTFFQVLYVRCQVQFMGISRISAFERHKADLNSYYSTQIIVITGRRLVISHTHSPLRPVREHKKRRDDYPYIKHLTHCCPSVHNLTSKKESAVFIILQERHHMTFFV